MHPRRILGNASGLLVGANTVAVLRQGGHEVIAASRKAGANTATGEGLKEAMADRQVMTDVSNARSFDAKAPKKAPKLFDEHSRDRSRQPDRPRGR
ncbi:hypothetical protein ABIF65_005408 [Bradyrhizobium japonicum]|nr:hypothetical protein [Bradyrhizobium japonicum]MCP1861456.1 hypothetical protein [Bradyrhizobium japonicum]MCP1892216.1 hypothetical protein [Bradyrhizobium japonicum]MCW2325338.1 hypothetical protein [Bradyrhizobium japonicum]